MRSTSAIVLLCGLLGGCNDTKLAAELAAGATHAVPAANRGGAYAQPRSPCDVVDLRPLGDVGAPSSGVTETEGRDLTGCVFDLTAKDANNTFKLFVSVDSEPDDRYGRAVEIWTSQGTRGYVTELVAGVGTNAIYAVRLTDDDQRIEAVLAVLDQNLYLEARFLGAGNGAWDAGNMRNRLAATANAAMSLLPSG